MKTKGIHQKSCTVFWYRVTKLRAFDVKLMSLACCHWGMVLMGWLVYIRGRAWISPSHTLVELAAHLHLKCQKARKSQSLVFSRKAMGHFIRVFLHKLMTFRTLQHNLLKSGRDFLKIYMRMWYSRHLRTVPNSFMTPMGGQHKASSSAQRPQAPQGRGILRRMTMMSTLMP